jgi:benzoyl-CoA reductase/2-hydroxyglutaryl-CoA dehydratase subunit BcrC/BadD/HgdB
VLVTGCPIGGDSTKVFATIEEAGGVIVGLDSCTGLKPFIDLAEENTGDPAGALARKYLNLPCSCMTPNDRRLAHIDNLIEKYKIDAVIDVVLHACHSYNIESHRVGEHIKKRHNLPFLKIVTDYSKGDIEQIRTRVEALFEGI